MLNEKAIDSLIQVLVDRQENINAWVIKKIAERIKKIGTVKPSDVKQLIQLRNSGADAKEIVKELSKLTALQVKEIQQVLKFVAMNAYADAKPFYDFRKKSFIPYAKNTILQRRMEAIARQTAKTYVNMAKAQAFMIRDLKNPSKLIPTPLSKVYQSVVDEAIQATSSGVVDYNTAMRRTLKQLVDSGLRTVTYHPESGRTYTQRMDTALRRNLLDGVRQINQEMQNIVGEQFGADGVEISVHAYPAHDHAEMQGHQYTKEEFAKMQNGENFKDVQGREYQGFERAVGTLNCRHFAMSIVIGYSRQNYTDEQLSEILRRNEKGYTTSDGKHLTMYDCTQEQRRLETLVRKAKDGQVAAREAGDEQLAKEYQAKVDKYTKQYKTFSKACGLSEKTSKMTVSGYRKIK